MSERFTRMMERGLTGFVAAGLAAALLVVGSVAAQPRPLSPSQAETVDEPLAPAQRDQLSPMQRGGGVSLAQATDMARNRFPGGRVVRAEPVQMGDRVVYEIRILDAEGVVRNVRIDAQTGSFL